MEAGRPDASSLLANRTGAEGIDGTPMPPPAGGLSEDRLEAVRAWIAGGAPCD